VGVDDFGEVVVEQPGEVERVPRLGPVAEHDRDGREHLHVHAVPLAVGEPGVRVPAVGLDLAERLAVDHHAGAAGAVVLQLHEAAVAVAVPQVGPVFGQDVRVQVDLHRASAAAELVPGGSRHPSLEPMLISGTNR
jgi:hypothetical protein